MRRATAVLVVALLGAPAVTGPAAAATAIDAQAAASSSTSAGATTAIPESPSGSGSESATDAAQEPDPSLAGLLTVPPAVEEWFATEAPAVARSGADTVLTEEVADRADDLSVGDPRPVLRWSEALLDGSPDGPVVATTYRAVAPVLLETTPVGVVLLDAGADAFEGELLPAPGLPATLAGLDSEIAVVHDSRTDAWYGYANQIVWPLDDRARGMLAGSADVADYRPFLMDPDPVAEAPAEESPVRGVVTVGALLVGAVLLTAAVAFWIRVPDEDEEDDADERPRPAGERLRSRVRAELRNGRPGSWSHRR